MTTLAPCPGQQDAINWFYAYLIKGKSAGGGLDLVCGHDADTPTFVVHCPGEHLAALRPYLAILIDWHQAPEEVSPPLIPLVLEKTGRAVLSLEGVNYDYPQES